MLATDLAMALDPVRISQQAGIDPDPWQARVLRSTSPRLLLNCSRQSGKSSTSAILAVWTAGTGSVAGIERIIAPVLLRGGYQILRIMELLGTKDAD